MARSSDILVRALESTDVEGVQRLYSQRSIAAMTLQVPFQSRAEIEARLAPNPDNRRLVAVVGGEVAGEAGLHLYQRRRKHAASIGMAVSEEFQGQGVGTALLTALLDLADNWYALDRVELEVYTDNEPAIHLYQKFGFEIEGLHRRYALRLGTLVDAYTMARLGPQDEPIDRPEDRT